MLSRAVIENYSLFWAQACNDKSSISGRLISQCCMHWLAVGSRAWFQKIRRQRQVSEGPVQEPVPLRLTWRSPRHESHRPAASNIDHHCHSGEAQASKPRPHSQSPPGPCWACWSQLLGHLSRSHGRVWEGAITFLGLGNWCACQPAMLVRLLDGRMAPGQATFYGRVGASGWPALRCLCGQ